MKRNDPRMCCRICFDGIVDPATAGRRIAATRLGPRHTNGNDDEPGEWIPICEAHVAEWFEDVPRYDRMPMLKLGK